MPPLLRGQVKSAARLSRIQLCAAAVLVGPGTPKRTHVKVVPVSATMEMCWRTSRK